MTSNMITYLTRSDTDTVYLAVYLLHATCNDANLLKSVVGLNATNYCYVFTSRKFHGKNCGGK